MHLEDLIVTTALENFQKNTPLRGVWNPTNGKKTDGQVDIYFKNGSQHFLVECKKEIRKQNLPTLIEAKRRQENILAIAENIYPKEELRKAGINYIDVAGNAFIETLDHFVFIEGNKKPVLEQGQKSRAFTKTGLKLVFHLLLQPDSVNAKVRELATWAEVSLDTVHKTFLSLKQLGFILPLDHQRQKLVNRQELFRQWMIGYETKLKPTLHIGNFRFLQKENFENWQALPLHGQFTQWGAEAGADILTHYLRPEILTLYTSESKQDVIKNYRLIPDKQGKTQVYQRFWQYNKANNVVVPPLLIYADLINTGDPRNMEVAQKIYEQFLQDQLT